MKEYCRGKSWKNFCFSIVTSRWHCKPGNAMASSAFSQQMALNSVEYSNWVLERPSTSTSGAGRVLEYLTALSECNETFPDYRLADDAQLLIRYLAIVSHLTIVKILYCNLQPEGPFPTQDNSWLRHFCFNGHLYGPLAKAQRIFPTKEIETQ